ncbi:MAG: inositol monophosphatase family protein [Alkalispirochaeta sp.]
MKVWDVSRIRDLLLEAGRIALSYFESTTSEHKSDYSLVTPADRAVEEYLRAQLVGDGAILIGEESAEGWTQEGIDAALAGTTWIVDPIDGTAPYANHLPTWGISLGLMNQGTLVEGALFLPRTGEMFITSREEVLFHRGARNPEYWAFEKLGPLPREARGYVSSGMISLPQEIVHSGHFSGRNPIQSNGSAVYSVAKLIRGSYICYVARIKLWDLAGALPILHRLGHRAIFEDGRTLSLEVSGENWVLDAADPRLWKSTGLIFVAADDETIRYMQQHYVSGRRDR